MRNELSDALVWLFMSEGCSAEEVAEFGKISKGAALAWMSHAARAFAREAA